MLGGVLPAVGALERVCRRTALVSAVSAAVVAYALAVGATGVTMPLAVLLLGVLLVPAAAAWRIGSALGDLRQLPDHLKRASVSAVRDLGAAARPRGLPGVVVALFAVRRVVAGTRGGWGRARLAARLARLARLPAFLAAVGLFALNALVIALGVAAASWLVLS